MEKPPYKLSAELLGHTGDIRAVASFADGTIVSTSRDKTARIWKKNGNGREYVESAVLRGHSNFICCVCVMNPSEQYPKGFIITGSNDSTICIYVADETEPKHIIKAHHNTVCNLRTSNKEGMFLSSSWDLTAKVWKMDDISKPQLDLVRHTAAVWCVADLTNGNIITGSADNLAIVWAQDGSVVHELKGHLGCIRDISAITANEFLTCANDAVVRHWDATLGVCLGTYSGHQNYIYSIVSLSNGKYVFTSGEDRTIRVWYNGEMNQTITLPTQSVWCISLLPNTDIISGSSDGVVRIFSADPDRYANADTLRLFEKEVANTKLNAAEELGGIKVKDLPDAKALQIPGQKDGQTKIVNEGDGIKAYSWSQSKKQWVCVGDVMGASGGTAGTSGKQLYHGIEYDYVFSVDIQDGVPPIKLPYNNGEDPWHVAQKFLYENGLSQLFLDQVANFIIKNSCSARVLIEGSQYADPFTGGSRYIPGRAGPSDNTNGEPAKTTLTPSNTHVPSSYIPHFKYLKLEQANLSAILNKLHELNSRRADTDKVSEEKLEGAIKLAGNEATEYIKVGAIDVLKTLLNWPNELVFPALDIARLAILRKEISDQLCTDELLQVIRRHVKTDASASNQMLTFRLLANMFHHEKGEKLCLNYKDEILKTVVDLHSFGNKNNQVAISTYILNLVVAVTKYNDTPGRTTILNVIFAILPRFNEPEAIFRVLVGLGTLITATPDPDDKNELIRAVRQSETALNILWSLVRSKSEQSTPDKVANCSKLIIELVI